MPFIFRKQIMLRSEVGSLNITNTGINMGQLMGVLFPVWQDVESSYV